MRKILFFVLFIISVAQINGQEKPSISEIINEANTLYKEKNYKTAKDKYLKIVELADFEWQKMNATYNAARCLALQKKVDSAFVLLDDVVKYGFKYKSYLMKDSDLAILHKNKKWEKLVDKIPEPNLPNNDPNRAQIVTSDIHNFWQAYNLVREDSLNAKNIYKKYYFEKASDGMQDYMGAKVSSIDYFVKHVESHPRLYKTIKENTLMVDEYKKGIQSSFKNLKEIYPKAIFPDVYFIIGAFTSGGTVTPTGLLIGVNQMSDGEGVDTGELDFGDKLLMNKSKYLPNVVAHELIHFQQDGMKKDTTTLGYVIQEGMADFIGELISGETPNRKIFEWAKGKENKIWSEFKKDMYYDRYNNWIANYKTASEDSYPDLGYWVGYEICKSYYEKSKDKRQAINEMLNIQDYKEFLKDSKWEHKLKIINQREERI
ncbi:gliding motility protein GldB-related protein [Salegentibacter maritimus]|uniref:DUF2268 domain-containing protein n=1 Tax=Salegentibacter maritimus TaxID=2794347 RepID=A0ABS0TGU5_9FLAO|nr:DUF2268 domain-containing putative Zn-dependent protease [Salegentibacter maritimus]MBI6120256.1 hypothetical protein [Salegentibacter maritimus]